jgi:SAM-dependent methyltransferase
VTSPLDWRTYGPSWVGPSTLSDKLVDWQALAAAGGESLIRDKDVLDVGPAWGVDAYLFAPSARSWTVVDGVEAVLGHVTLACPSVHALHLDLRHDWPFGDEKFGLVLDFSTIDDVGHAEHCYRECARVLRHGGTLLTTYANALHPSVQQGPYAGLATHPDVMRTMLDGSGLHVVGSNDDGARAAMWARR